MVQRGYLTDKAVQDRLRLSRSAFYRYLQSGVLTPPVGRLGKNRRGWTEQDIALARVELQSSKAKGINNAND